MRRKRIRAVFLAAAVIGWSGFVAPRLPARWLVLTQAVLGAVLAGWVRAPLGLCPPALWRGMRLGSAVAAVVATAVGSSTALPPVRYAMRERALPRPASVWLLVLIPLGTVWSEEVAFRGALATAAEEAFGPRLGRLAQAAAFGMSHVSDARGAEDSVCGTVLVTALAGWAFGWLHDRTGSLAAPMLAHLAIDEAGAVTALLIQNRA